MFEIAGLHELLEAVSDGLVVVQRDGAIVLVNGQLETLFGYDRDALLGRAVEVLLPGAVHDIHVAHRAEYARQPSIRSMGGGLTLDALHFDGHAFQVEVSLSPVMLSGEPMVMATVRESWRQLHAESERDRLLAELRVSEERFQLAFDQSPVAMAFTDLADPVRRTIVTANQALADLLGRPLTELAGSAFADITHPDDNSGDVAAALTMVHGARRLAWEKRYLHADGSAVWIEIHAATLESLNGTKMTIGHIVDIRDRRLRESEQARNNRFLEALTEVTRGLLGAREDSFDLIARCGTACVEGRGAAVVHVRADEVRLLGTHGTGFDRSAIVSVDSSGTIVEQVMRSGIAQLLRDDAKVEDVGLPGDVAGVFASLLLTPLMRRGVSDGVLIVGRGQGVNAFEPVELDLLTRFSQQASIALEVAEARVAQQLVEAAGQRARIARDLHDTIADCISAISIQADAAALIVHDDPKRAVVALQRIRDATSESLRDMRRVIALLRAGDAETDSGISRIDELRALARGASAFVELQVACEALDTSVEVWRAMYRIVQESLTNVRRHCPASTRIDLGISVETAMKTDQDNETGSVVRILVSNDQCAATWFVVGHGLTGMRERVELLGGRFTAGFDSSHRWIVDAAIPIDRAGT